MKNVLHEYLSEIVGGLVVALIIYGVTAIRDVLGSVRVVMIIGEVISIALYIYVLTLKQKGVVYPHQPRPRFGSKARRNAKILLVSTTAVVVLFWFSPMAKHENETRIKNDMINSDSTHTPSPNSQGDSIKFNKTHSNEPCMDFPEEDLDLYEEQIRRDISKYLEANNAEEAIRLWRCLRSNTAKDEECDHIFDHCLKNGELDKAEEVLKFFRIPSKKDSAQTALMLEIRKRRQ